MINFRENTYLLVDGEKHPIAIETIRQSWNEFPSFEGYFLDPTICHTTKPTKGFEIKNVIFNDPATIVLWADGTKTVVKCQPDDFYSEEMGLALCIAKKALGNKGNFNNVFRKWLPENSSSNTVTIELDGCNFTDATSAIERLTNSVSNMFGGKHYD